MDVKVMALKMMAVKVMMVLMVKALQNISIRKGLLRS